MAVVAYEWPVMVLDEGAVYCWPYGMRALIAERKRVQEIECLRHGFAYGQFVNHTDPNIFKFPLSFEEAFVRSDTERIAMMDRLCVYCNFNWKRDAMGVGVKVKALHDYEQKFLNLKREADTLFNKRIEDVLLLQALTEELMPETRDLVKRCVDFQQLKRCMLYAKVDI